MVKGAAAAAAGKGMLVVGVTEGMEEAELRVGVLGEADLRVMMVEVGLRVKEAE